MVGVRTAARRRSTRGTTPSGRLRLARSHALQARAARLIPGGSQTFSKGPTQFVQGAAPAFLVRGKGSRVWDVDGNAYIDWPMALGAVLLGYDEPEVRTAVERQLCQGVSYSLPHPLEVEVAAQLSRLIPCADMVRFGKNGSDATTGAVRLARAYTGRDLIACCGYHGWQDWYIGTTTRHRGVPDAVRQLTIPFVYNDLESLRRIFAEHPGQVAAVILEPVGVELPRDGFLERVEDLVHQHGALLIFDEVLTGFRVGLGGAQEFFGVIPDLACFGKGLANGLPLSAIVGRRHIMQLFDEVFFSFTFGGDTVALAAASATLRLLERERVVPHLWAQGRRLQDSYNELAAACGLAGVTSCVGLPPRTIVTFADTNKIPALVVKSFVQQECFARGALFTGNHNLCWRHGAREVDETLRVYRTVLEQLAVAIRRGDVAQRLAGPPVEPVFRAP